MSAHIDLPSNLDPNSPDFIPTLNEALRRLGDQGAPAVKNVRASGSGSGGSTGSRRVALGWDLQDCSVADDASDPLVLVSGFTPSACRIRVKVVDASNDLELDILRNGSSIFATRPLVPAGTAGRDIHSFYDFAPGITISTSDDVTIDVLAGGSWQCRVVLSGSAL